MRRIKFLLARAWDRVFSRSCWCETVEWVYGDGTLRTSASCPTDCDGNRNCWCGKKTATRVH